MAVVGSLLAVLFVCVELRAFYIQVLQNKNYSRKASNMHQRRITLYPRRGTIYDRAGKPLALTVKAPSIYIRPREIKDKKAAIQFLHGVLGISRSRAVKMVKSKNYFLWVKRYASERLAKKVSDAGFKGFGIIMEYKRVYPQGPLAAHLLGFAGVDTRGLEGIEEEYNKILQPDPVEIRIEKDGFSRGIVMDVDEYFANAEGNSIVLTIDTRIQAVLEEELRHACEEFEAKYCMGLVMSPNTGEVLAGAVYPSFDPNHFSDYSRTQWRNRLITDVIEPGSTFKVFLLATALQEKVVSLDELFYCENGRYPFYDRVISDYKPFGYLSVEETVVYSSNICAGKIALELGTERMFSYIRAFGFGERTGIDFPGESLGILRDPSEWSPVDLFSAGFGQGLGVTPLQLLNAFNAVINGGYLLRPYLVAEIRSPEGRVLRHTPVLFKRRILDERVSALVRTTLVKVVEEGTGRNARIPGYKVGGKTGTAQKFDIEEGRYSDEKYHALFIGMAPARNPKFSILIVVDEPQKSIYGGEVAAPVFRRVMEYALRAYDIPPDVPPDTTFTRVGLAGETGRTYQ